MQVELPHHKVFPIFEKWNFRNEAYETTISTTKWSVLGVRHSGAISYGYSELMRLVL